MIKQISLLLFSIVSMCYGVDLPPTGLYFQLVNRQSNKCPYSNADGRFGHHTCNGIFSDQYWTVINYNSDSGSFQLKNKNSGKCLYSNADGRFNAFTCNSMYNDQFWTLNNNGDTYFRLKNVNSKKCLYSNNDGRYNVYWCDNYLDQQWSFNYENYEIYSVSFDYNNGEIVNKTPFAVGQALCDNEFGSTDEQSITFAVAEDITHTSSFSRSTGFSISVGVSFSTGIPFIANGEISTTISASQDFTWGKEQSTNRHYAASFEITCAAGEVIEAEAAIWTAVIDVPYVITLKTIDSDIFFESRGIWSGTTSWQLVLSTTKINE